MKSLQCDQKWTYAGGKFTVVTIGWVYGPTFDSDMKSKIDGLFQKMWDAEQLGTLWGVWVNMTDPCIKDRSTVGLSGRLSFWDFNVIFAAVGLLAVLLILCRIVQDLVTSKNRQTERQKDRQTDRQTDRAEQSREREREQGGGGGGGGAAAAAAASLA